MLIRIDSKSKCGDAVLISRRRHPLSRLCFQPRQFCSMSGLSLNRSLHDLPSRKLLVGCTVVPCSNHTCDESALGKVLKVASADNRITHEPADGGCSRILTPSFILASCSRDRRDRRTENGESTNEWCDF